MRILFVSVPLPGHVQPMLGLAVGALALGHQVGWATAADAAALPRSHRIEALDAGVPFGPLLAEFRRRWPEGVAPRQHAAFAFPRLFGEVVAGAMLAPLQQAIDAWRPALIVNEPAALAAPLAAAAAGVRHVTHAFGLPFPDAILADAGAVLAPAWQRAGLAVPAHAGLFEHAAIEIAPPTLLAANRHPLRAPRVFRQRPAAVTGPPGARLPAPLEQFLARATGRPVVYATFGTVHPGGPAFEALLQALAEAGPEICAVVTTGPRAAWPAGLALPPHLWVGDYLPQHLVLPHCAAVVSHAGSGTALAALAAGLPQLCLPQGADQFRNADALCRAGAALMLEGEPGTAVVPPAAIGLALQQLLGSAEIRRAALMLKAEVEATPGPDDVAAELGGL